MFGCSQRTGAVCYIIFCIMVYRFFVVFIMDNNGAAFLVFVVAIHEICRMNKIYQV